MGFSYVFMMQAAFSFLINYSSLYVILDRTHTSIEPLDILGTAVFIVGFAVEVIADYQL